MKNQKTRRLFHCALLLVLTVSLLALPTYAAETGDIAGAVSSIWTNVSGQIKNICNTVVFPALSWVCGIGFVIAVVVAIFNYNKHHSVEVGWPIFLLIGLIVSLAASSWVWDLIGA